MVLDGTSLEPSKDTDTWDSPDLESRYASVFPLKINREHLQRPGPFLLYTGFGGSWNWERTVMYRISKQLETIRGLLRRDPTQTELDALVEHTSREANTKRIGLPVGTTLASMHAYYTARKQLNVPASTSIFQALRTAWQQTPAADRRQAIFKSGFRYSLWILFAVANFGALASYRFTVAISSDDRLAALRDAIRRYAEARMQRLEGSREKTHQRREERDVARHATANVEEQPYGQDTNSQSGTVSDAAYDNRQWQTQSSSSDAYTTHSSSSSQTQDFFDDASPTAPEYQKSAGSQTLSSPNENAWERIRRENASRPRSTQYNWGQQQSNAMPASTSHNSQSSGERNEFSSYDNEEQKGMREREAAQKEFDRMLEAERQSSRDGGGTGNGENNKNGWKRW